MAVIVEYRCNEAASGQSPTQVLDAQANPMNLGIVYSGSTPEYMTGAGGRALQFPAGNVDGAGAFSVPIQATDKVYQAIHGATAATLEVVAYIDPGMFGAPIANLFGVNNAIGEHDALNLWWWDGIGADFTGPGDWPDSYYWRRYNAGSGITAGWHVFHVVVDTNNPVQNNRLITYMDGVRLIPWLSGDPTDGLAVPLGETIAIPLDRVDPNSGQVEPYHVQMGCYVDYWAGNGGWHGAVGYAAIHDVALLEADVYQRATALLANHDEDPSPPEVDPMQLSTIGRTNAATGVLAQLNSGTLEILTATDDVLATINLGATAFTVTNGVGTANGTPLSATVSVSGNAAKFNAKSSGGVTQFSGTVGTTGADVNLDSIALVAGGSVSITSATYTQPA